MPIEYVGNAKVNMEMFIFDNAGSRLFGIIHKPNIENRNQINPGYIFCSPFGEERGFTQRLMVEWANEMCRKGHYVLRFDYRGYGDSHGLFEEYTIDNHLEDLGKAIEEFNNRVDAPLTGLCGIRLGATIAVLGAQHFVPHAALILWEPVVNGDKYADLLLRGVMAKEMANTGKTPRNREQLKQCLANGDKVILEGHPLTDDIYHSLANIDLLSSEQELKGPVQIIQFSKTSTQKPRPELSQLKDHLSKSTEVSLETVKLPALWTQIKEYIIKPAELFNISSQWLDMHTTLNSVHTPQNVASVTDFREGISQNKPNAIQHVDQQNLSEKPVQFLLNGNYLRGILHLSAELKKNKPVLLLLSPGFNCRTARYRLYVRIAREAAERGWATLRYDPRGLGDSDGSVEFNQVTELYNMIETGFFADDVLAAIEFAKKELEVDSVILIGLCGGAAAGIYAAAQSQSVVGMIPIETPICNTINEETAAGVERAPLPKAQADHFLRSYIHKLFSLTAWRHFLSFKSDYKTFFQSIAVSIGKRIGFERAEVINDQWFIKKLGQRANLGLISRLKIILNKDLPTFFIFGSTYGAWNYEEIKTGLFPIKSKQKPKSIKQHIVKDADPGFSLPHQSRELIDNLLNWLDETGASLDNSQTTKN